MDAKVLRAAVSAAIRVTVSTTLIGCGGQMSTDAAVAGAHATGGPMGSGGQSNGAKGSDNQASVSDPKSQPASGGKAGTSETTAGAATAGSATGGGTPLGGMASLGGTASAAGAGSAGEPNGGAAPDSCACTALLASVKSGEVLSSDAKVCCQTIFADYFKPPTMHEQCSSKLDWFLSPAHDACCNALNAWQVSACTPWGPPVPPELALAALLEWEAAA
jgi:hypothetical protein